MLAFERSDVDAPGTHIHTGHVAVITPFNFPLEIPALQTLSALFMGNRPLLKVDEKVSIVIEQFLRLLIHCGMPKEDVDLLYSSGPVVSSAAIVYCNDIAACVAVMCDVACVVLDSVFVGISS